MRIPARLLGAAIVGIVGSTLAVSPLLAKGRHPSEDKSVSEKNACKGTNGCAAGDASKGDKHSCKGEKASCKGMNDCKGKGGCKTDKHACKGMNECKGQGGCKS